MNEILCDSFIFNIVERFAFFSLFRIPVIDAVTEPLIEEYLEFVCRIIIDSFTKGDSILARVPFHSITQFILSFWMLIMSFFLNYWLFVFIYLFICISHAYTVSLFRLLWLTLRFIATQDKVALFLSWLVIWYNAKGNFFNTTHSHNSFVLCLALISHIASLTLSFDRYTLKDALELLQSKGVEIKLNEGFKQQLSHLEIKVKGTLTHNFFESSVRTRKPTQKYVESQTFNCKVSLDIVSQLCITFHSLSLFYLFSVFWMLLLLLRNGTCVGGNQELVPLHLSILSLWIKRIWWV
jgi:hypothetical protein